MMLLREITAGLVLLGVFVGSPVQLQAESQRRSEYQYHDLASSNKSKGRKSLRGNKAVFKYRITSREVPTSQDRQDQRADFTYKIAPIVISIVDSGSGPTLGDWGHRKIEY